MKDKDAENTNWRTTLIVVASMLAVAAGFAFLLWVQQEYGDSAVTGVLAFAAGLLVGQVVRVFDIIHTRNTLQNAARMAETKAGNGGGGGGGSSVLDPSLALLLSLFRQQQPTSAQTDMMTRAFMSGIESGRKQIPGSPWDAYELSLGDPAAAPDPADIWSAPPASSNGHRP